MTTENLTLFKALGAKMDYLNTRQRLIAENIANSDTPGYRPQDLKEADFSRLMRNITEEKTNKVSVETTNSGHLPMANSQSVSPEKARRTYEVSPGGNAVVVEEQLINSQATAMDYSLMTNIYQKNVSMLKTAIGGR